MVCFDGKTDEAFDNTAALDEAVEHILKSRNDYVISFPAGKFHFHTKPKPFPIGIKLIGNGPVGASELGTLLVSNYSETSPEEGFLCWDGSEDFHGTGGGVQDLSIMKGYGWSGGTAIKLTGSEGKKRCGFWEGRNLLVGGLAYDKPHEAIWDRCLLVDGTAVAIPGSMGVRDLSLSWWNFNRAKIAAAELRGATHFFATNGHIYQGGDGAPPSVFLVTGKNGDYQQSIDVHFSNCSFEGALTFDHVSRFSFVGGMVSELKITSNACDGLVNTLVGKAPEDDGHNVDVHYVLLKKPI